MDRKIIELKGDFSNSPKVTKIQNLKDGDIIILHMDIEKYNLDVDLAAEQYRIWQQAFPNNTIIAEIYPAEIEIKGEEI